MKTNIKTTSPHVALVLALPLCLSLGACATIPLPAETPLNAEPLVIMVPRDLEGSGEPLKGIHLDAVDRTHEQEDILPGLHSTSNTIMDFFSVNFILATPGILETRICRGEQHSDGHRYRSCVFYDAHVATTEVPSQYRVVISPFRIRTEQGRNAIFVPIGLPKVTLADWYRYVSDHTVASHFKIESRFGPESIKGNFDRRLPHATFAKGEANGALRQFKDAYVIEKHDGHRLWVGTAFYPYRDGSLLELYIQGHRHAQTTADPIDWTAALASGKAELTAVASE